MRGYNLATTAVTMFNARLVRLTRLDGTVLRIAEAETSIVVDGETFVPLSGCQIQGVKHALNGEMPSTEIGFAHSVGGTIDTAELNDGLWDGARVEIYLVDRASLTTLGDAHFTGSIQPVTLDPIGQSGSFDIRGLAAQAEGFIQTYQPMCRTDLFSVLCGLDPAAWDATCTVASIVDRFSFTVTGLASPPADGWYNGGLAVAASGLKFEIAGYTQTGTTFRTYLPRCALMEVGEVLTLYPGCDKTAAMCKDRYGNLINFQGEPHFLGINSIVGV